MTIQLTNLVSKVKNQELVKSFGITELFFLDGEFYTTSNYSLDFDLINELEKELEEWKDK